MSAKRLYITVINDHSGDQRVQRIASSLSDMGFEVHVLGRKLPHSPPLPSTPYHVHRMKLFWKKGKWFYFFFNIRLFFFLLFRKVDLINACDLDTLLAAYLIHRLKGIPLIYDSHEYFTEVPELVHRPGTKRIWERLEAWLFPKLKHAYTVNHSLANIYQQKYGVPVNTIHNLPLPKAQQPVEKDNKLLIYQGALNLGRGIELMIESMKFLPTHQLWIIGKGDVEEQLQQLVRTLKLEKQVTFKGFVAPQDLHALTSQASLGLSLEENLGMNYYYASPNKVYDYIQAKIPVLLSDFPEMKRIVEEFGVGECITEAERSPEVLAIRIKALLEKETSTKIYTKACEKAAAVLNWGLEEERLKDMYRPYLV